MANKGLQFEHAVMYSAMSRVTSKSSQNKKDFDDAAGRYEAIPNDIKQAADRVVQNYAPSGLGARQEYYSSFEKMSGGGEEPKTDIKFKSGSTVYKCSMKWGDSFNSHQRGLIRVFLFYKMF